MKTDEIMVTKEEIEVGKIALATLVQMGYELRLQRPAAMQTPNKDLRTIEHAATTFVANMALYANLAIEAIGSAKRCPCSMTAAEARAELEADGVDVDGFLKRLDDKIEALGEEGR